MGLFDRIDIDPDLADELGLPTGEGWQSKSIPDHSLMREFEITAEGHLTETVYETEEIPEDERENGLVPIVRRTGSSTEAREYSRTFTMYTSLDEWYEYEVSLTDGHVDAVRQIEPETGEWRSLGG